MSEAFLHYIWKYQYFEKKSLHTTQGQTVEVFAPGFHNTDSGPDFKEASIAIENIQWSGQVEIHYKASDWDAHGHQYDKAYNNTVLHVVWEEDKLIQRQDGSNIPTLELANRVSTSLLDKYGKLIKNPEEVIPCHAQLNEISSLTILSMLDKVVHERLQRKTKEVIDCLHENNDDWEEATFQMLAKSFGFKKNSEPFYKLAKSIPYKILKKHADKKLQVESLLFGQSGLLETDAEDQYLQSLTQEYDFLKRKYALEVSLNAHQWKFLRLRPANFPTIRIAQFAAYVSQCSGMLSTFLESDALSLIKSLRGECSAYWKNHYRFGKTSKHKVAGLGLSGARNILINTVAPVLAAYSLYTDDQKYMEKAVRLLEELPSEKNRIVDKMQEAGFDVQTAFDTQAVLELHNSYCKRKKCLHCTIGAALVRP